MDDTRDGSHQPQLRDLLGTVPAAVTKHNPTSAGTHGTDGQKPAGLRYRRYAPSVGIAAPGKTRVSIGVVFTKSGEIARRTAVKPA